jgi:hypothetical protein
MSPRVVSRIEGGDPRFWALVTVLALLSEVNFELAKSPERRLTGGVGSQSAEAPNDRITDRIEALVAAAPPPSA